MGASDTNAEILRDAYEALNRGDTTAALDVLAPEVEWHESRALPERDTYRGREEVGTLLRDFLEPWEDFRQEVEEVRAVGDRVALFLHLVAEGRTSGARVDARYAHVWTMRDGKAVRVDAYYDRGEALAALASKP
jgi:ketosteroid isomerase-like protein